MTVIHDRRTLTGREYLRVSQDRSGTGRSPDQQHDDNVRRFDAMGWTLHPEPYRDDDRSASRFASKPRPDFDRLVGDLETGEFGADVLVFWEASRGSRELEVWARLINLCERAGVLIYVTKDDNLYDPSKARDRKALQDDGVDSEHESGKTSERIRRDTLSRAEQGGVHGKRIYGYRRIYDPKTGRRVAIEPHPEQAPIVQEAARRVLAGESAYSIARDFNVRGIPPRRASYKEENATRGWVMTAIRQMLEMPAYAGLRQHLPKTAKKADPKAKPNLYEAEWPALIEREDWDRLQSIFTARSTGRGNFAAKYLLTGIATCGECGAILRTGKQGAGKWRPYDADHDGPWDADALRDRALVRKIDKKTGEQMVRGFYLTYLCSGGGQPKPGQRPGFHVAMKQTLLDYAIGEAIVARLERPDFLATIGQRDHGVDEERARLLAENKADQEYLQEVERVAAKLRRFDLLTRQEALIRPRMKERDAQIERLAETDPIVIELARSGKVRAIWEDDDALTLDEKRRIVRALVQPILDRAKVPGQRGLDLTRLERSQWN